MALVSGKCRDEDDEEIRDGAVALAQKRLQFCLMATGKIKCEESSPFAIEMDGEHSKD